MDSLTFADLEKFGTRVGNLKPGTKFVTIIATDDLKGDFETVGTVQFQTPSCTVVEVVRESGKVDRGPWCHESPVIKIESDKRQPIFVPLDTFTDQ